MTYLNTLLSQLSQESAKSVQEEFDTIAKMSDYAIESAFNELTRGVTLLTNISALHLDYCNESLSYSDYSNAISGVIQGSGFQIPVTLIAPSFESDDKSQSTAAKQNVFQRTLAYLKDLIARLVQWVKDRFGKKQKQLESKVARLEQVKGDLDQTTKDIAQLGVVVSDKGVARLAKPEDPPAEVIKDVKLVIKKVAQLKSGVNIPLPKRYVTSGKFNANQLSKDLSFLLSSISNIDPETSGGRSDLAYLKTMVVELKEQTPVASIGEEFLQLADTVLKDTDIVLGKLSVEDESLYRSLQAAEQKMASVQPDKLEDLKIRILVDKDNIENNKLIYEALDLIVNTTITATLNVVPFNAPRGKKYS